MPPDRLRDEHIEVNFRNPTVEVISFYIDNRLFVLGERANKQNQNTQREHRASDLQ